MQAKYCAIQRPSVQFISRFKKTRHAGCENRGGFCGGRHDGCEGAWYKHLSPPTQSCPCDKYRRFDTGTKTHVAIGDSPWEGGEGHPTDTPFPPSFLPPTNGMWRTKEIPSPPFSMQYSSCPPPKKKTPSFFSSPLTITGPLSLSLSLLPTHATDAGRGGGRIE